MTKCAFSSPASRLQTSSDFSYKYQDSADHGTLLCASNPYPYRLLKQLGFQATVALAKSHPSPAALVIEFMEERLCWDELLHNIVHLQSLHINEPPGQLPDVAFKLLYSITALQ